MKKKLFILCTVLVLLLMTACGANNSSKNTPKANTMEDFNKLITVYVEKQQALMLKQAEGMSGDFEELSEHAKQVVESSEYGAWTKAFEKIEAFDATKLADSKKIQEVQEVIKNYSNTQSEYFQELAKATDKDAYNEINVRLATKLGDLETDYIEKMEKLDY